MSISRRELLQSSAASGAGLLIAFAVPRKGRAEAAHAAAAKKKPLPTPNAFVRIAPDESVTVLLAHSEMGQGIWTTLAMMIAEELDCDWSRIHVEHAPAAPVYAHTLFGMQMTGGSSTTYSEFERYRTVGAMAREMLVRAAAHRWKTDPKHLRVEDGFIYKNKTEKVSFGQVALEAEKLKPPESVTLKDRKDFKLLGKPMRRIDSPDKITGKAQFGMDIQFPGLRTAVVARAPVFGAKVKSFDAAAAKAVPGVEQVVQIPSGVAVVAKHYWAAKVGRDALKIEWELGPGAAVDSAKMEASYRALAKTKGAHAGGAGDAEQALATAKTKVEAEYYVPYLAHAPMEPLNCTVKIDNGACEIWTGTQFQTGDQGAAAKAAGVPPEKVTIHTPFLGGGFGRRANPRSDFVFEGVAVAKAAGVPVKTVWTREDDIRGGFYRPAFLHRIEAGLDDKGAPVAWKHTIVGQSIMAGTPFAMMIKDGIDSASVEGAVDSPYLESVAARQFSLHSPVNEVPVLWWRSVGNTHTAFAMESMLDELAHAAGQEPLAFRLALLKDKPRHANVLKTAAEKAGWGTPPPAGRARGLAVHASFESIVAQVAEVSVENGEVRVHKMTCAVDCGFAVNPLGLEAQMQGAIAYALGPILHSEVTLKDGRVEQSNFHDYQVLRLHEMPEVAVHIVPSDAQMGGAGEPGTPPVFPAVANAVFALTGKRLRSLPLRFA